VFSSLPWSEGRANKERRKSEEEAIKRSKTHLSNKNVWSQYSNVRKKRFERKIRHSINRLKSKTVC